MSSPPFPPKRWAQSDSDVGPVVGAVVRYAQHVGPSPARLEGIRQGVLAHGESDRRPRRSARRAAVWAAALLVPSALVVGWLSFVRPHDEVPPLTLTKEPPAARSTDPAPAPEREPASAVTSAPRATPARPSKRVAAPSATLRQVIPDIETLQRARRLVSNRPGEALSLTRQHATQYPRSEFSEEREALRIEALVRLGREAEARREFESFAGDHPRSVYLRRMGAWFSEASDVDAAVMD